MWGDAGTTQGGAGAMQEDAGAMWRDAVAVWGDRYCRLPFCPSLSLFQSSG